VTTAASLYRSVFDDLERRIAFTAGASPVAVYGLGKMGLPLAAAFAELTGSTIGVDVDPAVVSAVEAGDCPVANEPGLPDLVAETVECGALRATTDGERAASQANVHVLIVPTTLTDGADPDLGALRAATETVGAGLSTGDLVIVESTVPPGTTAEVVDPILAEESGLDADRYGLAFCPERTASGTALRDIRGQYPKIVGGVDAESTRVARLVYEELSDNGVVSVSDARTAEAVKLFEGLYRDVNIALANELALLRDELGVDVREAIAAANGLPMCDLHDPGAGVGGHCIPYYPYFVMSAVEEATPLLRTARETNDRMPGFVLTKVREGLLATGTDPGEATVAVLGLAYRPGVNETRASPAKPLVRGLSAYGTDVVVVDPVVTDPHVVDARRAEVADLPALAPDAVALVTAHEAFAAVDWTALDPTVVVDGRAALDLADTHHYVYTVGSGPDGRGWAESESEPEAR
jgi:UDP-N-acetyl-D-mannosaminuronic acid dehydrogenase